MHPDAGHSSPLGPSSPRPAGWRGSRWLAIVELILVALIFLADFEHHIYISKTLYLLVLAAVSLRVRRVSWRTIGFRVPRNWPRTLAAGLAIGLASKPFNSSSANPCSRASSTASPIFTTSRTWLETGGSLSSESHWHGPSPRSAKNWSIADTS